MANMLHEQAAILERLNVPPNKLKLKYRTKQKAKGVKKTRAGNSGGVGRRAVAAKRRVVCAKTAENARVFEELEIDRIRQLASYKKVKPSFATTSDLLEALKNADDAQKDDVKKVA